MGRTYSVECRLPDQGSVPLVFCRAGVYHWGHGAGPEAVGRPRSQQPAPHSQNLLRRRTQPDILDQLNSLYEELLASQEWFPASKQLPLAPNRQPLSALEVTRYLVGWPPPQAGVLPLLKQQ